MHCLLLVPSNAQLNDVYWARSGQEKGFAANDRNWVVTGKSALRVRRAESCLSTLGPIADVRVLQVKQVQQVNANGQFVLFSIPAILTIVVVVGRFELPLIDGAQAKFKSD